MTGSVGKLDGFIKASAVLVGYPQSALALTGVGSDYLTLCEERVGTAILAEFLEAIAKAVEKPRDASVAIEKILDDHKLGPVGRNIIQLWYLGGWSAMPGDWRETYRNGAADEDMIPSALAYKQGLVWKTLKTHPMGAKAPGFGSWALNPPGETE